MQLILEETVSSLLTRNSMEANVSQPNVPRAVFSNTDEPFDGSSSCRCWTSLPHKPNSSVWKYAALHRFLKEQPPKIGNKHICFNAGRRWYYHVAYLYATIRRIARCRRMDLWRSSLPHSRISRPLFSVSFASNDGNHCRKSILSSHETRFIQIDLHPWLYNFDNTVGKFAVRRDFGKHNVRAAWELVRVPPW